MLLMNYSSCSFCTLSHFYFLFDQCPKKLYFLIYYFNIFFKLKIEVTRELYFLILFSSFVQSQINVQSFQTTENSSYNEMITKFLGSDVFPISTELGYKLHTFFVSKQLSIQ